MRYLLLLILSLCLMSCNQQNNSNVDENLEETSVDVDSLNAEFVGGWNQKDSAAIINTIAEDAIVMNDSLIHKGKNEIAKNWISGGVKVLSNIRTHSLISDAGGKLAYDGGTYTLDLNPPGGPLLKERGIYSLIWNKRNDGNWKLKLIHIEDVTRLPDIK